MSGPRLVESLDRLAGAETAPLADAVHGARDFIDAALKNFGTTYQLLLEVTALCTEMRSQFGAISQVMRSAHTTHKRASGGNPAHQTDAAQAKRLLNRELVKAAATFDKTRMRNYIEFLGTCEKTMAHKAAQTLQNVAGLHQAAGRIRENAVLGELIAKFAGLEMQHDETIQQVVGYPATPCPPAVLASDKDAPYSLSGKGYKIVKEYSDE